MTKLTISIPTWLKSKIFWIPVITILIEIGNNTLTAAIFPGYTNLISWVVAILGIILTAVQGASEIAVAKTDAAEAKAQLAELKNKLGP